MPFARRCSATFAPARRKRRPAGLRRWNRAGGGSIGGDDTCGVRGTLVDLAAALGEAPRAAHVQGRGTRRPALGAVLGGRHNEVVAGLLVLALLALHPCRIEPPRAQAPAQVAPRAL